MMRRIEALFNRSSTTTTQRSDLCEMFSCPPCTDIVRKFRKFAADTSIRERDSELIHLQRLTASEYDLELKIRRLFDKAGLFKTARGLKDKDGNIIYKDEDGSSKDKEGINKYGRVSFKDIYGSLKDEEGINKDEAKSFKDKDESVKYREGISKDREKGASGAARLPENLEGKTQGSEAKTSKTSNLKGTTGKAKEKHDTQGRETETSKQYNLKETTGKAKGIHNTQGREVETSKTNNLKDNAGKAKERQDTREVETSKTNNLKGNAGKAKERQDTHGIRNAETSKTNNLKGTTGKAKSTEEGSCKTKEYDEINKDVKLRKSIDEGSKITKKAAVSNSNITKKESKLGKRGGIQNNASDSRIIANELDASKSKAGDQEIGRPVIRKKIDEYTRQTLQAKKVAEEAERHARANADKTRQMHFNEAMQAMQVLLAAGDEQSVDRTEDQIECPQYEERQDIIIGNRVYKMSKSDAAKQEKVGPAIELQPVKSWSPPPVRARPLSVNKTKVQSSASITKRDGVLRYSLSERIYISKGWTMLPKEIVMRKVPVFLMRPARQKYDWLEMNKHKKLLVYPSGESLATFEENKTLLYYRSGKVALELYKAEGDPDTGGDRVVVYSACKPVAGRAQPRTVLAVFDYSGNGAVYDHAGQIRLKYTQSEGVVIDRSIGPHTHWKWHNLSDSQLFQTVLIENQPPIKDHTILEYEQEEEIKSKKPMPNDSDDAVMRGIEAQKVIKKTKKLLKKYAPFEIKMKAVKINEYFSLKIFEQPSIFLSFSDGKTHIKINVGMVLDPNVVVGEDFVEVGEVPGGVEGKLACSESVERLQRVVQGAREAERARVQRERRLNDTPSYLFQKQQKKTSVI